MQAHLKWLLRLSWLFCLVCGLSMFAFSQCLASGVYDITTLHNAGSPEAPLFADAQGQLVTGTVVHNNTEAERIHTWLVVRGLVRGTEKARYSNGEIAGEWPYEGGKRHGLAKTYYSGSGRIASKTTYAHGQIVGTSFELYEDGSLRSEQPYKAGKPDGTGFVYHTNGRVAEKLVYAQGLLEGCMPTYTAQGELEEEACFAHGERQGPSKYYTQGRLRMIRPYAGGVLHGVQVQYFEDGRVFMETPYTHGTALKQGVAREYHPGGVLKSVMPYVDGEREGMGQIWDAAGLLLERTFFHTGQLKSQDFYEQGRLDRTFTYKDVPPGSQDTLAAVTHYYPGGAVKRKAFIRPGGPLRDWSTYRETGELEIETTYQPGSRTGVQTFYDSAGRVTAIGTMQGAKREGLAVLYYPNGMVRTRLYYVDDLREGPYVEYAQDGSLARLLTMVADQCEGPVQLFLAARGLRETFLCKQGKAEGEAMRYNAQGRLVSRFFYLNDRRHGPETHYDPHSGKAIQP